MGSLTIVGLGPAKPEHMTLEAAELLRGAVGAANTAAYGMPHARHIVRPVAPGLAVQPLEHFYLLPGDRQTAYELIAQLLMEQAFGAGRDVLFLTEGSPLVLNWPVVTLRHACAQQGRPLRLVQGMSFIELVLDQVLWLQPNLQFYSARSLALGRAAPTADAPALIHQLGEHSAGGDVLDTSRSVTILAQVRDRLLERLPPEHRVTVLYSSGAPDYASRSRRVALADLAETPVPIYSNLWVPALNADPAEAEYVGDGAAEALER
jgi:uncharacterized protein YabN with tetrapyrrole methylase and pyrophosphatase domain